MTGFFDDPKNGGKSASRMALIGLGAGFLLSLFSVIGIAAYLAVYHPTEAANFAWLPNILWGSGAGTMTGLGAYAFNTWQSKNVEEAEVEAEAAQPDVAGKENF
jgi:hypothetical protein